MTTAPPDAPPVESGTSHRRRNRAALGVGLVAALIGAGVLITGPGQGGRDTASAEDPPVAEDENATEEPNIIGATIVETDPITVSLADNGYLRVGVSLQLAPDESGSDVEAADEFASARAIDLVVSTYSAYTKPELISPRGRLTAKRKMTERVMAAYDGEIAAVYLTGFVVQ